MSKKVNCYFACRGYGKSKIKDYDLFLENIKFVENNVLCGYCKDITLVNTNPFSYEFLCCKCGNVYLVDEDELLEILRGDFSNE